MAKKMSTGHTTANRFDTYSIIKRLVKQGFKEQQAKELVDAFSEISANDVNNAATKLDLADVERRLSVEIEKAKYDMVKWQIGTIITISTVVIACFKLFTNH
jgi:DNA integrity scanning protein DisA with diadenylate cyclase activity